MPEANFQNRTLYHGDNLEFLRGMNSETVHLIATDPPFNKNRDFHATPDSLAKGARFKDRWRWDDDVQEEWVDSIKDDWPAVWEVIDAARVAYGDDMGAFLCWLGVRLMEMRRILRPDGSIYLHIDHTAHAYVKCLMDGIFGAKNFRNAIIWHYDGPQRPSNKNFATKHDTILRYSKSDNYIARLDGIRPLTLLDDVELRKYKRDEQGRYFYDTPKGDYTEQSIRRLEEEGRIRRTRTGRIRVKHFLIQDSEGNVFRRKSLHDVWHDIPSLGHAGGRERTGYPTQKPLALYRRIIEASSNEGDIVLDPFCGCATTPVAAEQLKRRWVGMDIWDKANDAVRDRLRDEWLLAPDEAKQMLFPHTVHYKTDPPIRTDDNEVAAPNLKLKSQRIGEPWEKLKHSQMVRVLAHAQGSSDGVICAGCGRVLEVEFMQLDHIMPRTDGGANHILNRVLLCGPCNRRKRNHLTLSGLVAQNRKKDVGWMKDADLAKLARDSARSRAEWVRDEFDSEECKALIAGKN